jgi:hypothetical protein
MKVASIPELYFRALGGGGGISKKSKRQIDSDILRRLNAPGNNKAVDLGRKSGIKIYGGRYTTRVIGRLTIQGAGRVMRFKPKRRYSKSG